MSQAVMISSNTKIAHQLKIRAMRVRDIRSMRDIFHRSVDDAFSYFPHNYRIQLCRQHSLTRLLKAYLSPRAYFMLLTYDTQDIGYCMVRFEGLKAYLFWMYVDPAFRGIGAGEQLLRAALDVVQARGGRSIELVTHDKEGFYAKYGFQARHRVAGLMGGVDMVIMEYIV